MFRSQSRLTASVTGLTLAVALSLVAACKSGKGTSKPGEGGSVDIASKVAEQKKAARVQGLVEQANEDLRKGRYLSASRRAEEALAANPDNADAHAILGAARWRAGDYDGSTSAYREALEIEPANFGAALGLARNLQAAGQHTEAISLMDRLLEKEKEQVDPMLAKLRSLYSLAKPDDAAKLADDIFKYMDAEDPQLPVVQAYNAFLRPLEGKGPFLQLKGNQGTADLQLDLNQGLKHAAGSVKGSATRVAFLEIREENIIDKALVKKLKLKDVGKYKPVGQDEEVAIVIVPSVKFGDIELQNVPSIVQDLSPQSEALGDELGMILGRQGMQAFGTLTFDFPGRKLALAAESPASAPAGTLELPLLMVDMSVLNAPAVPIRIDGSQHDFFVYFGGVWKAALAITKKDYLKSGHLPREVESPDDPSAGLKMVYVDSLAMGGKTMNGLGGLVMVNEPADQTLHQVLEATAFELGGYLNMTLLQNWKITYALPKGRVFISNFGA